MLTVAQKRELKKVRDEGSVLVYKDERVAKVYQELANKQEIWIVKSWGNAILWTEFGNKTTEGPFV